MWLIHTPTSFGYRLAAGAAVGALVFVILPLLIREVWPPANGSAEAQNTPSSIQPPIINQGPGSAYSYGQQGGITAGTVNIGPGRLAFSSQLGADLLAKMPVKKPILLRSIGGAAD